MYRHDPVLKKHAQAAADARAAGTDEIDHVKPKLGGFKALFNPTQGNPQPGKSQGNGRGPSTGRDSNSGNAQPGNNGQKNNGQVRPKGQKKNNRRGTKP